MDSNLIAEYICNKCSTSFVMEPGPVSCTNCGDSYVEWMNYEKHFESGRMELQYFPNKILKMKSKNVEEFGSELVMFCNQMINVMKSSYGIGLAANQVGHLKRVVVMKIGEEFVPLVNPAIIGKQGKQKLPEGCLSFPNIIEVVERNESVKVRYQTPLNGTFIDKELLGIEAVCIQHEIDHLDGIVFIDKMSRLKRQIVVKKLRKKGLWK